MITRSKYWAQKKIIDGIKFDSIVESLYYIYLKSLWIKHELQPKYILQEKFENNKWEKIRAIHYIADFSYWDTVVDIKGMPTSDAKIKRKIFMKLYPELKLERIVRYKWERVDYFANEKRKKQNKKIQVKLLNIN
jgi:hypothetical protein